MKKVRYNNKLFKILNNCSFKFSNNEVTFNDIVIDFTGYSLEDIPFKYQKIEIVDIEKGTTDGKVVFTGYLDGIDISTMKKKKEFRELTLTLLSPLKMATIRTSSLIGTFNVSEAITRVLQPLIDDGFVIKELNVEDGQITTNLVLETIENCMNNICSKRNIFWYINERREIFINSINILFGSPVAKALTEENSQKENGLINIKPTIQNIDYANIINFKNVRLIYSEKDTNLEDPNAVNNGYNIYPILKLNKNLKNGDVVTFDNPIIVDEDLLKQVIEEKQPNENEILYALYLNINSESFSISITYKSEGLGSLVTQGDITYSDNEGTEGKVVLQRDSFFKNLITGFKWNGDDNATVTSVRSDTALRYTTMKFVYTQEIEKLKGIISDSGQVEKTIDYQEKWTTLNQLTTYGRSLIVQNSNIINSIELEYDKNPNLEIGNIVSIEMPSFFAEGNFAVKEINYTYKNEIEQNWKIIVKSADLISTYIDMFRPAETEETQDKIDTVILSEFIEEGIKEIHTVSIDNGNHTLNFNL